MGHPAASQGEDLHSAAGVWPKASPGVQEHAPARAERPSHIFYPEPIVDEVTQGGGTETQVTIIQSQLANAEIRVHDRLKRGGIEGQRDKLYPISCRGEQFESTQLETFHELGCDRRQIPGIVPDPGVPLFSHGSCQKFPDVPWRVAIPAQSKALLHHGLRGGIQGFEGGEVEIEVSFSRAAFRLLAAEPSHHGSSREPTVRTKERLVGFGR